MSALLPILHRTPPRLYRASRWLRRISTIVLVLIIVYLLTTTYSAVRLIAASAHQSGGFTAGLAANETVEIQGTLAFTNPGFYPVQGFEITVRVLNGSGSFLGQSVDGPLTLPPGASTTFPLAFFVPLSGSPAAETLLVTDQPLVTNVWGNATYAFLFPVSIHIQQNQSWGAPFADLAIAPGAPTASSVPVTLSFSNHADFADVGILNVVLGSASGLPCGNTTYPIDEPSGGDYSQTETIALAPGCSIAGGYADASYLTGGSSFPLPREALP